MQKKDKNKILHSGTKWALTAIILFTALLYSKAIFNDFVYWDDDEYILKNPFLKDFSFNGIKAIFSSFYAGNYHPLTTFIYMLEYKLFGTNPICYHIINVLLHLLNTWLVYKVVELLSGKKITSLVVSALFAIHPMHVESVAWLAELKDMMYSLFYLLSLLVYLRYIKSECKTKLLTGSILLFLASLLSKSAAVTLPVLLFATDIYKGRKINAKLILEKVPFLLLSVLFGVIAIYSQNVEQLKNDLAVSYNFLEKIFLLTYAISFYIIKTILPFNLSAMHYFPYTHNGMLPWLYYASLLFFILIVWLLIKKTVFQKEILFGFFFFLITLSVMLQIIPVGNAITAERYTYLAYIGVFYIAGYFIEFFWTKNKRKIIIAICIIFTCLFSFQTLTRIGFWKNGTVLFADVVKKNSDVFHPYWILGNMKNNKNDFQGALFNYNKAVKLNSRFAPCYINRGEVYNKLGDYQNALQDLNRAISIDATKAEAYNNRGMAYDGLNYSNLAITDYNKAIALKSKFFEAYLNRGMAYDKSGKADSAMSDFNTAVFFNPEFAKSYNNRGVLKAKTGAIDEALTDINKAIKLAPNYAEAYCNRGNIKAISKDMDGACADWQKAIEHGYAGASQIVNRYCK